MSDNNVDLYGKIAKFPKNTKAKKALLFCENIKIPRNKLWYILIEKENVLNEQNISEELQVIKYNNNQGVNCKDFIEDLKKYYSKNQVLLEHVNKLVIDGNDKFSVIRNIPNVEINGKKLISILSEDIIKLLHK